MIRKSSEQYIFLESEILAHETGINVASLPKVSFAIPTLNNEATLRTCLESIAAQEYPDFEIVITDGYSNDRTMEIAKKYTGNIYFDKGLLGSARQTCVEHSKGEIIAMFDSDIIIPHKKWLINAVRYFNIDQKVSTVWPLCISPPRVSITARLYSNLNRLILEDRVKKKRGVFGGGNALFLKKSIDEIGGIDRSLHWGEDFDWAKKLKAKGYHVVYITDPLYHDTMRSLKEFTKKQFKGAKTFAVTGFQLMNLSLKDVIYEQVILGLKGMSNGLIIKKDTTWFLFPLFILIKGSVYGYMYFTNLLRRLL